MFKNQLKFIISILLVLGLSISLQSLLASWQAPESSPPNDNIAKPINEGSVFQKKYGSFDVAGDLGVGTDLTVLSNLTTGGTIFTDNIMSSTTGLNIDSGDYGMEFNIDGDGNGADRYVFKINGAEIMNVDQAGNITITGAIVGDGSNLTNINWNSIVNVPESLGLGGGGDTYVVPGLMCPGGDIPIEYEHISKTCSGAELQEDYTCENSSGNNLCSGATNCSTLASGGWINNSTPYTCSYKSEKLSTLDPVNGCFGTTCSGTINMTCTSIGSVKCMDPNDIPLHGDQHTVGQCSAISGTTLTYDGKDLCKFSSACPSGWSQYSHLTTTSQNFCGGGGECGNPQSCTTGNHNFQDKTPETCTYYPFGSVYLTYPNGGDNTPVPACTAAPTTCMANITAAACY